MASLSEIIQLCRLCLVKDHVNISIFDDPENVRQIPLKISSCLPVKISRDDNLPKKICDGCSSKLDLCYDFWTSTAQAEKTLLCMAKEKENQVPEAVIPQPLLLKVEPAEELLEETQICEPPVPKPIIVKKEVEPAPTSVENEAEEPAAKRPRRSAAIKAQMQIAPESDDDDAAEGLATTEDVADVEDDIEDPDIPDMNVEIDDVKPGPSGLNQRSADSEPQCSICLKVFASQGNLKRHSFIHSQVKKFERFICGICNLPYVSNFELQTHFKKMHPQPYLVHQQCQFCGRGFKNRQKALKKHILTKHDSNYRFNFQCSICEKVMTYESSYVKHMESHDIEELDYRKRRCVCEICGKEVLKKNIRPHTKMHQGIKPHKCEHCGKCFANRKILRHHIRTHTKEKPHKCPVCSKGFTQPYTVTIHMRYHTGERPFSCHLCDKGFVTRAELRNHKCKGPQEVEQGWAISNRDD